jgi:hypothetical protein
MTLMHVLSHGIYKHCTALQGVLVDEWGLLQRAESFLEVFEVQRMNDCCTIRIRSTGVELCKVPLLSAACTVIYYLQVSVVLTVPTSQVVVLLLAQGRQGEVSPTAMLLTQ